MTQLFDEQAEQLMALCAARLNELCSPGRNGHWRPQQEVFRGIDEVMTYLRKEGTPEIMWEFLTRRAITGLLDISINAPKAKDRADALKVLRETFADMHQSVKQGAA